MLRFSLESLTGSATGLGIGLRFVFLNPGALPSFVLPASPGTSVFGDTDLTTRLKGLLLESSDGGGDTIFDRRSGGISSILGEVLEFDEEPEVLDFDSFDGRLAFPLAPALRCTLLGADVLRFVPACFMGLGATLVLRPSGARTLACWRGCKGPGGETEGIEDLTLWPVGGVLLFSFARLRADKFGACANVVTLFTIALGMPPERLA